MRFKPFLIVLALLALASGGCAAHSVRHTATVSVVSGHAALVAIQSTADLIVCGTPTAPPAGACLTAADRAQKVAPLLSKAFDYDAKAALIVRGLPEGAPPPGDVAGYLAQIGAVVDQVLALFPSSQPKTALVASLGGK
jgi:hypothetical protein